MGTCCHKQSGQAEGIYVQGEVPDAQGDMVRMKAKVMQWEVPYGSLHIPAPGADGPSILLSFAYLILVYMCDTIRGVVHNKPTTNVLMDIKTQQEVN